MGQNFWLRRGKKGDLECTPQTKIRKQMSCMVEKMASEMKTSRKVLFCFFVF